MKRILLVVLAVVASIMGSEEVRADVPAAQSLVGCYGNGSVATDPAMCSTANESATVALLPDAMLTATASYPGGSVRVTASSLATLTYYFAVLGGTAGDIVPIEIDYRLAAQATGSATGDATFSATTSNGSAGYRACIGLDCVVQVASHDGSFRLDATVGATNHIDATATATGYFGPGAGTASATIDPYIFVDPSFAHASDYRIAVSAGVGNAAPVSGAVPEPASWVLLVGGFALVGAVRRRRPKGFAVA